MEIHAGLASAHRAVIQQVENLCHQRQVNAAGGRAYIEHDVRVVAEITTALENVERTLRGDAAAVVGPDCEEYKMRKRYAPSLLFLWFSSFFATLASAAEFHISLEFPRAHDLVLDARLHFRYFTWDLL